MAFTITQNNLGIQLLNNLLGNTAGLSNFSVRLTGDGRAFGTFSDDPFGLGSGVVLSTGKVADLAGTNAADGGFSPGESMPLTFAKLTGTTGGSPAGTAVYYAELSGVGFDIRSFSIADGGVIGGAGGNFSGFDLDAIKFSNTLVTSAAEVNGLPSLASFDFSPAGTIFTGGSQRPPTNSTQPDLFGSVNGSINNAIATLQSFDANSTTGTTAQGFISLGELGRVGFNLNQPVATDSPLYLYIGEVGDNGELAGGQISVSNRPLSGLSDLSTDFGVPGEADDTITLELQFDADVTTQQVFFQFVFGSEELVEYGGLFNDAFRLELNGFNLAALSDKSEVTINNLVPSPFLGYNPDFIYSPVETGVASDRTRLDGFTKPLTFIGDVDPNTRNTLKITLKDNRDGLLDSAVFLRAGTFSVDPPATVIDPSGGQTTIDIPIGRGTVIIDNFGGVGRGLAPSAATIAEVDTLRFMGTGLSARNLLLTQVGANLELTFAGVANTKVVLRNFNLENLDNLRRSTGATVDLGNILFDGDTSIADSFDVFNHEWTFSQIFNSTSVTFLNNLDNRIRGLDSNDVINAQGGVDRVDGGKGDDLLRGGTATDILRGGEGNDILIGGADVDLLSGDQGSDHFVLVAGGGNDIIEDFQVGTDMIVLADGLILADIAVMQGGGSNASNTLISLTGTGEVLATLIGVQTSTVAPSSFIPVSLIPV